MSNPTEQWRREVQAMAARASSVDWSRVDWSKLKASDIGVKFGAPMTEEEFKEYRRRQGARPVHVIRNAGKPADPEPATSADEATQKS